MEQHIKVLAILFVALGCLGILVAVFFFLLGAGAGATILSQDQGPDAQVGAAWATGCMTFLAALIGILSIPSIITGWGLWKHKSWSRILAMIIAVLNLPSIPIGTAIGIYALVIMMNDETKRILSA
jgi:hypothetical protein